MTSPKSRMTAAEWRAEGARRFGPKMSRWKFVCPMCKHIASVADWKSAGAPESAIAFSCVGRWVAGSREAFGGTGPGPCNYAGGGLFALNPVEVVTGVGPAGEPVISHVFQFADVVEEPISFTVPKGGA